MRFPSSSSHNHAGLVSVQLFGFGWVFQAARRSQAAQLHILPRHSCFSASLCRTREAASAQAHGLAGRHTRSCGRKMACRQQADPVSADCLPGNCTFSQTPCSFWRHKEKLLSNGVTRMADLKSLKSSDMNKMGFKAITGALHLPARALDILPHVAPAFSSSICTVLRAYASRPPVPAATAQQRSHY